MAKMIELTEAEQNTLSINLNHEFKAYLDAIKFGYDVYPTLHNKYVRNALEYYMDRAEEIAALYHKIFGDDIPEANSLREKYKL